MIEKWRESLKVMNPSKNKLKMQQYPINILVIWQSIISDSIDSPEV